MYWEVATKGQPIAEEWWRGIRRWRVLLPCRSTEMGAFTSAGGRRVYVSRSGHHWVEEFFLAPGEELRWVDVSNSGRRSECCWVAPPAPEE